jgi:hydrogenase/urease accessory protein HupE
MTLALLLRRLAGDRWRALALLGLWLAALAIPAGAHELTMAEMNVREISRGQFSWAWGQSASGKPIAEDLQPRWPEDCRVEDMSLKCPATGLVGRVSVEGVGQRYSAAMLRITWLDGQTRVYTITSAQPSVMLYGAADDQRGVGEVVRAYTVLGVEHILTGIDHLFFVIGLLFLVGFRRRLILTITAFTVAHSLTLASSVLGLLTLRPAPVEATIALSIVLVAGEALRREETLSRRLPSLVAFLFGLVHGLGFAGALQEIGLPEAHLPVALLTFNVGVEIGQLAVVAAAWMLTRLAARQTWMQRTRTPVLYVIGAMAVSWTVERLLAMAA